MSLEVKIFKGVSWLAVFNLISQIFSWVITIVIARILVPEDYGLMAMSTIITSYALSLSELGLGNAIIQRPSVTKKELSSVFWFMMGITVVLGISCFPVSYLTAHIMHEPRVIPITQTVAIIFLINGFQIIPSSLLRKEMNFKAVGSIDLISTIISSIVMLIIANCGGAVWTLLFGFIVRSFVRTILLFKNVKWFPTMYFSFAEAKPFLTFGLPLAGSRTLAYVQERSGSFFAGRAWNSGLLGFYNFAQDLSRVPTDKIVSLINTVSFSAFSQLQNDQVAFNKLYLNISKVTAAIVLPLFIVGFIMSEDIIRMILNPKWFPMIMLFKLLCLSQIFTSLNAINNFAHSAQGRPKWSLYYSTAGCILMPISFYFAVPYGLNAIAVPWLSTYILLASSWIFLTIKKLGIPLVTYVLNLRSPLFATILMAGALYLIRNMSHVIQPSSIIVLYVVPAICIILGVAVYVGYFWLTEGAFLLGFKNLYAKSRS